MIGIFEGINTGMLSKTFNGEEKVTIGVLQGQELVQVKVPESDMERQLEKLELYKPIKLEIDVSSGTFNGKTYVNYKLVRIVSQVGNGGK